MVLQSSADMVYAAQIRAALLIHTLHLFCVETEDFHFLWLLIWYFFAPISITVATKIRNAQQGHLQGNIEKKVIKKKSLCK